MNVTSIGSFEYPANGGWKKETNEKNIAPELGIHTGMFSSYTIEIETKGPAEIKLDGYVEKTTRTEAKPDIFHRTIGRRGMPSARGITEFIVPADIEYRVYIIGTAKK